MITKEEYLKARAIVDEYEREEYEHGMREADEALNDDDHDDDDENDPRIEYAENCSCGAWVFTPTGGVAHVSDCICGGGI